MNARKINISVTLDPDLLTAIERLARKEGVTVSALLRGILRAEMMRRRLIKGRKRARMLKPMSGAARSVSG
jgi:metal-responsive CopG/Arc/MetJ family transcriptional regulator